MVATINALCAVIVGGGEDLQNRRCGPGNGVHGREKPTIAAESAAIVATFSATIAAESAAIVATFSASPRLCG